MKKIVLVLLAAFVLSVPSHAISTLKRLVHKQNINRNETGTPSIKVNLDINIIPIEADELPNIEERLLDLDDDSGGDGLIPASDLYSIWNNMQVNPYKIPPDSVLHNDSVYISLSDFSYPLTTNYRVTSEFGPRRYRYHYGIDLKLNRGDSVVSAMDGMVRIAKRVGNYGNLVVIRHNNGLESFYGHLDKIFVKPDQQIKSGELIGHGGNTGRSTGAHLHFELRYLGQCINPRDLVDFDSLSAKSDTILLTHDNFSYRKKAAKKVAAVSGSKVWTMRSGDSLSLVAQRTRTSVSRLCALNGITTKTILKVGRKIYY